MLLTQSAPEREARGLLETLWRDEGGRLPVPVDPIVIARRLGIEVFEVSFGDDDVSGALEKRVGGEPRIYLNEQNHPHRQRFTCAHECGHYVKRSLDGTASGAFEYLDLRSHLSSRGTDPEERWANAFAAALLMPADFVVGNFERLGQTGLANTLVVSIDAMGHRLASLRRTGQLA